MGIMTIILAAVLLLSSFTPSASVEPGAFVEEFSPATYIVGEDIASGEYAFIAEEGDGSIEVYRSYDSYKNGDYSCLYFDCHADSTEPQDESNAVGHVTFYDGDCVVIKGISGSLYTAVSPDGVMYAGGYEVGKDIPSGKYSFTVTDGVGTIYLYNSYSDAKEGNYSDYFDRFQVATPECKKLSSFYNDCSESVSKVRLDDGMFVLISGVELAYEVE